MQPIAGREGPSQLSACHFGVWPLTLTWNSPDLLTEIPTCVAPAHMAGRCGDSCVTETGWSVSAIARHVGRDRQTVRLYLSGKRQVGQRLPAGPDSFGMYLTYCTARLAEDPHLWGTALFDEVRAMGYDRSYPSFTRALRLRSVRPVCQACHPGTGRPMAVIEHPAGADTQWDWVELELPDPPVGWDGFAKRPFLLVGALSHSSKWRGGVVRVIGTTAFGRGPVPDRGQARQGHPGLAVRSDGTVVHPGTGKVTASYAQIAKHSEFRSGRVRRAAATAKGWWRKRTTRPRSGGGGRLPMSWPPRRRRPCWTRSVRTSPTGAAASIRMGIVARWRIWPPRSRCARCRPGRRPRSWSWRGRPPRRRWWAFRGNRYSVPPELAGQQVSVSYRLGAATLAITTTAGVTVVVHPATAMASARPSAPTLM